MAQPRVALFVTCLVDLYRPNIGFSAIALLEQAGCAVEVPPSQTCCGQPAYNSGDRATTKDLARAVIDAFLPYEFTVAPSGSCAGMIAHHYPGLFADDPEYRGKAEALAAKTHELVSFLADIRGLRTVTARYDGVVTYHDSCSGLRELGVREQPRALLGSVAGLSLRELADRDVCCGFGGTFCVKYPDISLRMVGDKARDIAATGADTVLAGDLGCLLNIAGRLKREGSPVKVRHVAEVLAGRTDAAPAIGEAAP
jgi:L-lactate dehydrogenase complex protein LldE